MSRHSKNANTRSFFTSAERDREKGVWGTKRQRLEEDSQRRFDQCQLCLGQLREAVASPYGFLYCRECILENLVSQKSALSSASTKAHAAEQKKQLLAEASRLETDAEAAEAFVRTEGGVSSILGPSIARTAVNDNAARAGVKRERMDMRNHSEKVADAVKASPWLPAAQPLAEAGKAVAVAEGETKCPVAGKPLKAKQLIQVHLTPASSSSAGGGAGDSSGSHGDGHRWQCPACMKHIVYQKTILLAGCGHVTCADCCSKFVVPSKACYTCTRPIAGKGEVIPLQAGGSAFAALEGTQAEAQKYKPTLLA